MSAWYQLGCFGIGALVNL